MRAFEISGDAKILIDVVGGRGVRRAIFQQRFLLSVDVWRNARLAGFSCFTCIFMIAVVRDNPREVLGRVLGQGERNDGAKDQQGRWRGRSTGCRRRSEDQQAQRQISGNDRDIWPPCRRGQPLSLDLSKWRAALGVPVSLAWQAYRDRVR
jgi:hypothetical protein